MEGAAVPNLPLSPTMSRSTVGESQLIDEMNLARARAFSYEKDGAEGGQAEEGRLARHESMTKMILRNRRTSVGEDADLERRVAVVVVDPFSSGAILAQKLSEEYGAEVIAVHADEYPQQLLESVVPKGCVVNFISVIKGDPLDQEGEGVAKAIEELADLRSLDVVAVMPGFETGVELSDILAERFGLRGNDKELSYCRRDKYDMQETLRSAGVRACEQCRATCW